MFIYIIQVIQSLNNFVFKQINEMPVPIGIEKQWLQENSLENTYLNSIKAKGKDLIKQIFRTLLISMVLHVYKTSQSNKQKSSF